MPKSGDNIESHEIDRSTNHRLALVFSMKEYFWRDNRNCRVCFFSNNTKRDDCVCIDFNIF